MISDLELASTISHNGGTGMEKEILKRIKILNASEAFARFCDYKNVQTLRRRLRV